MKPIFPFLVGLFNLLIGASLLAQSPAIVVSTQGKVTYRPATGGKSLKLKSGIVIRNDGDLSFKKGSSVLLLRDGKFARFSPAESGKSYGQPFTSSGLGFEYDFSKYIEAAVSFLAFADKAGFPWSDALTDAKRGGDGWGTAVTPPEKGSSGWGTAVTPPEKGSSGWGNAVSNPEKGSSGYGTAVTPPERGSSGYGTAVTPPEKGSSGWGNNTSKITAILPFGNVLAQKTTFYWSNPGKNVSFQVEIKNEADSVVYAIQSRDTFCTIDLIEPKFQINQKYQWTVRPTDSTSTTATPLRFSILPQERLDGALKKVRSSSFFQQANDPVLTRLAEAVSLERSNWYTAARDIYEDLRQNQSSNLAKMMEAAFWARYELLPLAENAARK